MLKPWTGYLCMSGKHPAVLMDNKMNYCYDDIKVIDHLGNSLKIPKKNHYNLRLHFKFS